MARFYASGAPSWWRFQLVSLGNKRLPPKRYNYYSILVDNGMFRYYSKLGERPPLHRWFAELRRFIHDVERLRRPREIIVVLPDWLYDYPFTYTAARSEHARELCTNYRCVVVVHPGLGGIIGRYIDYAEKYAAIDWVWGLAAPLKLNCSRLANGRRVIKLHCQAAIAEQVCGVAKRYNLHCHGLGIALKPGHVKRLVELGLTSFDSSSWTRPNNSVVARTAWSAKTKTEKERFFHLVLARLREAGVELEGLQEAVSRGAGR